MIKVTLISPKVCLHCLEVKEALEKMKSDYPEITIEEIDMVTPEGQEMVKKYNIFSGPGIMVNDEFIASGSVTEDQLRNKFDELKDAVTSHES